MSRSGRNGRYATTSPNQKSAVSRRVPSVVVAASGPKSKRLTTGDSGSGALIVWRSFRNAVGESLGEKAKTSMLEAKLRFFLFRESDLEPTGLGEKREERRHVGGDSTWSSSWGSAAGEGSGSALSVALNIRTVFLRSG